MSTAVTYAVVLMGFALMVIAPGFITWILLGLAIGLAVPEWSKRFK